MFITHLQNPLRPDKPRQPNPINIILIKDRRSIADTFGHVRGEVEDADDGFGDGTVLGKTVSCCSNWNWEMFLDLPDKTLWSKTEVCLMLIIENTGSGWGQYANLSNTLEEPSNTATLRSLDRFQL